MPKQVKKTAKNLKHKATKRNDIVLAVLLGTVVTCVGLAVTRFSGASSNASFRRDPVKQMTGGSLVRKTKNTLVRVGSEPAAGVNAISTLVTAADMLNTKKVCVEYVVTQANTRVSLEYYNARGEGIVTPSAGTQTRSGGGVECLATQGQAVDGTVKIHVRPGAAQITKFYGVLREAND